MGGSCVLPDHGFIAGSGDSSQIAAEPFPVEPPLNFEDDNNDDHDEEVYLELVVGNVTGWVAGDDLQDEVGDEL